MGTLENRKSDFSSRFSCLLNPFDLGCGEMEKRVIIITLPSHPENTEKDRLRRERMCDLWCNKDKQIQGNITETLSPPL